MKLCGLVVLISLTIVLLSFNQIYAQEPSLNITSNVTTSEAVTSLNMTSNVTTSNEIPSLNITSNVTTSNVVSSLNSSSNVTSTTSASQDFYKQGNAFFDQGKYEGAIIFYDKALNIDPTNIKVLYNKALALDNLGKINEAISYYDKILAIAPNDTDTLNNKGVELDSLGKHLEAISSYDLVLAINPDDTDALYNKGVALDSLGKHDSAVSYYDRVLSIDPTNVNALNKMNLTFSNAPKTEINALHQSDQTLLIIVGVIISGICIIIIINLATRKSLDRSKPEVSEPRVVPKTEKEESTKTRTEVEKDDEWKGL